MAKRKRRKAGRKPARSGMPGWAHMLAGLMIGLAVALGIYVNDRRQGLVVPAPVTAPTLPAPAPEPEPVPEPEPDSGKAADDESAGISFDFYDMLPNLDVEIFDDDRRPARATAPTPARAVAKPGIYIIQAGSFSRLEDAERRKAQLGLLGVRSDIKRGSVNGSDVYRVYTDAVEMPDDVNRLSRQLDDAGIEILVKRVSD